MLGDAAQPAESDGSPNAATSGPRHAAPRKPLLTRLHVPAGKAVALAAMPTAVLMGMGFTPHFAQADEMPKSPFKPGPCVSRSDAPAPTASSKPKADPTPTTSAKPTAGPTPSPTASAPKTTAPSPSASPTPTSGVPKSPVKSDNSAPVSSAPKPSPSPTPTATSKTFDPLDPLGLGGLLSGLLGGGKTSTPTTPPAPTSPTTPTTPPTTAPSPSTPPSGSTPASPGPTTGTSGSTGSTPKGTTPKSPLSGTTDAVKKAAKGLAGGTGSTTPGSTAKSGTVPLDGSQSYPCPTYDAKALADATVEGGIPLLPDQPFTLKTTKLSLHGLSYHGIVKVRTWSGQVKDVLKFTATGIDIDNLWQIVEAPNGTHTWVKARAGSTSTFSNGTVTLYTESLTGNLLGLIPVTFTPKAPPPLTLPELFFTNATVVNAGQFGGDLHVPGMHVMPDQP